MKLPLPRGLEKRLAPARERGEAFLKTFEWTWVSAVVFCFVLTAIILVTLAIIPSWWLYFADQTLRWRSFWLLKLRDLIVIGWITNWFIAFLIAAAVVQNIRRRVRGETGDTRPTGGYR